MEFGTILSDICKLKNDKEECNINKKLHYIYIYKHIILYIQLETNIYWNINFCGKLTSLGPKSLVLVVNLDQKFWKSMGQNGLWVHHKEKNSLWN